jgi:hypothetical protein
VSISASHLNDPAQGYIDELAEDINGLRGVRHFKVNSRDLIQVRAANFLPVLGDGWPGEPTLLVTGLEMRHLTGGWSLATVRYGQQNAQNFDFVAQPNDAYTTITETTQQVPIAFSVQGDPIDDASVEANASEFLVTVYKNAMAWLPSWLTIANKLNDATVTLPSLFGITAPIVVPPRNLLARSYEVTPVREGLIRVTFRLGFAPADNWKHYQVVEEDEDGVPLTANRFDVYQTATYPVGGVLWP